MLSRGFLIALEGIDGAGKTTQAQLLTEFLLKKGLVLSKGEGFEVVCFKEPTQGPWGKKISEIAQKGREGITAREEMELFLKDREEDVKNNILPALRQNKIVIMDRYYYSSIAYQGALGLDPNEIKAINEQRFPKPDLVFILTIPPAEGIKRILSRAQESGLRAQQRSPTYEEEAYLTRVANIFQELAASSEQEAVPYSLLTAHCSLIDGMRPINVIHQEIASSVIDILTPLIISNSC